MPKITVTLDTEKTAQENYAELLKLAEFILENEKMSLLFDKAVKVQGERQLNELLNQL